MRACMIMELEMTCMTESRYQRKASSPYSFGSAAMWRLSATSSSVCRAVPLSVPTDRVVSADVRDRRSSLYGRDTRGEHQMTAPSRVTSAVRRLQPQHKGVAW